MKYEEEMKTIVRNYFEKRGYITLEECMMGGGIADVVAVKFNQREIELREKIGLERVDYSHLDKILMYLAIYQKASIGELSHYLSLSYGTGRRIVDDLCPYYLKKLKSGQRYTIIKVREHNPCVDEVISLELKLRDWKKAFVQAYSYLEDSDKVYVVILKEIIKKIPLETIRRIEKKGIGLFSVADNSKITKEFSAKKVGHTSNSYDWVGEYLYTTWKRRESGEEKVHRKKGIDPIFDPKQLLLTEI